MTVYGPIPSTGCELTRAISELPVTVAVPPSHFAVARAVRKSALRFTPATFSPRSATDASALLLFLPATTAA